MRATSAIVSAAGVLGVIAVVVVLGLDGGTESVGGLVGGPKVSLRLPSTPLRLRVEAEGYERTHVDLPRPDEDGEIVVVLSAASGG